MPKICGRHSTKTLIATLLAAACLSAPAFSQTNDIQLPALGDATSGIVSPQQERELGESWARAFRAQVPTSHDPLMVDYLEKLVAKLAGYSELPDKRIELLLVKNPTMNAFAVPGGVMGIHTGLFTTANTENQLASVLAHELGHLSQRHFARGVEARQNASIPTTAAMLASLVLMATAGGDAGMAAMMATQAASLDNQLRFSRQNEQEADRVGMETMVAAGLDPYAVPEMFESMLRSTRYSRRPPEFLLTHPVTESRIADSMNRATRFPKKSYESSLSFHLMRARVFLMQAESPQAAVKRFSSEIDGDSLNKEASRYGLVLAYSKSGQPDRAHEALAPLLVQAPNKLEYQLALADIYTAEARYEEAIAVQQQLLKTEPTNHPVNMAYADTLMKAGFYLQSEQVLDRHSRRRSADPYVWYQLAEVHGLAGNILGVHEARAEYFILNGIYDAAMVQLRNGLKLAEGNYHTTAILQERVRDVRAMQEKAMR
ncbi:M48 family metalloprotease [Simiduia curdlanivorans]|uniref:Putative beta-barrel assembly-enhancing protease n=1 Tax=Simiduia curdlanivorans TaxID=1492769 RepID=A0ABV8UZA7_9GAMM|nr:M48 family metalloprotease [Simiduia curdlanivorans]MDN3639144.1 M48 family metalloprotease [Simiduia curdlanivorans]